MHFKMCHHDFLQLFQLILENLKEFLAELLQQDKHITYLVVMAVHILSTSLDLNNSVSGPHSGINCDVTWSKRSDRTRLSDQNNAKKKVGISYSCKKN